MRMRIRKMIGKWGPVFVVAGLCFLVAHVSFPTLLGHAQQRVKPEALLPDHYPDGFHGYGRIERIGKGEIVIDEELLKLAPGVEYFTPRGPSGVSFDEGDLVGYLLNAEKKIISLWLIEK